MALYWLKAPCADVMKLAFVIYTLSPWSGLARDCARIANHAITNGHDVTVFVARVQDQGADQLPKFAQLKNLQSGGFSNHARMRSFGAQALAQIQSEVFDVSLSFNRLPGFDFYYCADASFVRRARQRHSFAYRITPRYRQLAAAEQAVFGMQATSTVLFVSDALHRQYREQYAVADARSTVLPPFVDPNRSSEVAALPDAAIARATLELPAEGFVVLSVGSGFNTKGVDRSIRAVAALPDELKARVNLIVVGSGKEFALLRLAESLGVKNRVRFVGPADNVPLYMKAADLLLHPARNEASGTVLVEAMQSGLAILCSGICGYAPLVDEAKCGEVLPEPFDQRELDQILVSTLRGLGSSNSGENGQKKALALERVSMPDIVLRLLESPPNINAGDCYLADDLRRGFPELRDFDSAMRLDGEIYRQALGRYTFKIEGAQRNFFVKHHVGVGWGEIFKNLVSLKLPVFGAQAEWQGAHRLRSLGVDTLDAAGFGRKGTNPARQQSFFISRELPASTSLDLLPALVSNQAGDRQTGSDKVVLRERRVLIKRVAQIVRRMHRDGINHRDLYLCHFWLQNGDKPLNQKRLFLIDLHRMQFRSRVPLRWRVKDLGGLYYSASDCGLRKTDLLRFVKDYTGEPLRTSLVRDVALWSAVKIRATRMTKAGKEG
jgi:UDP-glucose:(heptosyl)LPS alpha-1,3-glucosyltransferase